MHFLRWLTLAIRHRRHEPQEGDRYLWLCARACLPAVITSLADERGWWVRVGDGPEVRVSPADLAWTGR